MQNVDIHEVEKFSKVSDHWWDLKGPFRALHETNPTRTEFICQYLSPNAQVLDVGCGGGILSEALAKRGFQVTGIDASEQAIKAAIAHARENNLKITYQVAQAENLALTQKESVQYDALVCMELLEHVPNPKSLVAACAKCVRPGGRLFFGTLNRTLKSFLLAIVGAEYILRLLPIKTHQHSKFITPCELQAFAMESGLKTKDLKGIAYNPFFGTPKLTDDLSINYLLCSEK